MVFLNLDDLGWRPYIQSWVQKIKDESVVEFLNEMIEKWFGKLFARKHAQKDDFK